MTSLKSQLSGGIELAEDLDTLGRDEIEVMQGRNLRAMVAAVTRNPAVRDRWPTVHEVVNVDDLVALPLLTAAELAAGAPPRSVEFLLRGERLGEDHQGGDDDGGGLVLRSSGTAGTAKMMFHSWSAEHRVNFLGARGLRAGLRPTPRRVANCMFPGELNGAFLFVHGLCRWLRAWTFPLGSRMPVAEVAGLIAAHGIDTLVASPAYGTELVISAAAERIATLGNFLYLGEAIGDERREAITSAAPGLRVRSLSYSTNETGPIGYQCAHLDGNTHHVHEDAVIVEVVDERTERPVPAGTVGEVVVTALSDSGMALFRYRIGDRGHIDPAPCPCGSSARRLTLAGRTAQSMTVDVWTISTDQLMAGLAGLGVTDPAQCQLQVLWTFPTYEVRLLLSPHTPPGITGDAVVEAMRDHFQLNKILTSRRCAAVSVHRTELRNFASNDRGKVPVLCQRFDSTRNQEMGVLQND